MKYLMISVNGLSEVGGVERVAYYIKSIFEEKKINLEIISKNELEEKFKILKVMKFILKKRINNIYPFFNSLYLYLYKKDYFIISHGFSNPFFKNDILFAHGSTVGYLKILKKRMNFQSILEYFAGKNSKKIIAVSHEAKREWQENYNLSLVEIEVLNNCVDTLKFNINSKIKNTFYKNIIFCGRLEERKGIKKVLELAKKIEKKQKYKLIIATFRTENIKLFQGLKNTEMRLDLNFEEIIKFYSEGDIFYFPSLYEGFEMVTLEALASGIPVLGNDVGGIAELVRKKVPGVYLIDEEKEILEQIDEILEKNESIDEKNKIFNEIQKNYSKNIYEKKLSKLLFNKN